MGADGVFGEGCEEAEDDCWRGDYIEEQSGSIVEDRGGDYLRVWSRGDDTDYGVNLMECDTAIEQVRLISSEDLNTDANIAYCPLGGADVLLEWNPGRPWRLDGGWRAEQEWCRGV